MSIGKKLRFEVFKRDSFTCQYCGQSPPDVVLHVDHIHPVSKGGGDDTTNLITACAACNQGKGAREINSVSPRPDADLEWLEMQQEIAELRRYQLAKAERDRLLGEIVRNLQKTWAMQFDDEFVPADAMLRQWMVWAEPVQIEQAIECASGRAYKLRTFDAKLRYTAGTLHKIVEGER